MNHLPRYQLKAKRKMPTVPGFPKDSRQARNTEVLTGTKAAEFANVTGHPIHRFPNRLFALQPKDFALLDKHGIELPATATQVIYQRHSGNAQTRRRRKC